ncbi:MAG: recombinase family protein [Actinomycetes bacterium]
MRSRGPRAAIYTRISDDRTGEGAGVDRQRIACEKLAVERGLEVVAYHEDNSRSAMKGERLQYDKMLAAVRAGEVEVILVWTTDRLYRRLEDLLGLAKALSAHGVPVYSVRSGDVDLSNADGQLKANLLGSVAQHESQKKGERVREAAEQRAHRGRFSGGRRRFGYAHRDSHPSTGRPTGPLVLVPEEAEAIAWAYQHVMSGGSLEAVVREWRDLRGLRGPAGAEFTGVTVRDVLLRPINAGLAVYRGKVVGDSEAPAIVDREAFETVRAILTDPKRRTTVGRPPKSLLAPFLRCGVCGGRMHARYRHDGKRKSMKTATYACREGHVSRTRALLDARVTELVIEHVEDWAAGLRRPVKSQSAAVGHAVKEAEQLRDRLAGLSALAAMPTADGGLDPADYASATREIRTRLADVEARIVTATGRQASAALVSRGDADEAWTLLDDSTRRAVIGENLTHIVVGRGKPGRFDMTDVQAVWIEDAADSAKTTQR